MEFMGGRSCRVTLEPAGEHEHGSRQSDNRKHDELDLRWDVFRQTRTGECSDHREWTEYKCNSRRNSALLEMRKKSNQRDESDYDKTHRDGRFHGNVQHINEDRYREHRSSTTEQAQNEAYD